jgi:hypothetical protein
MQTLSKHKLIEYIDLVVKQAGQFLKESTCICLCSKGRRIGCGNMSNAEDLKLVFVRCSIMTR